MLGGHLAHQRGHVGPLVALALGGLGRRLFFLVCGNDLGNEFRGDFGHRQGWHRYRGLLVVIREPYQGGIVVGDATGCGLGLDPQLVDARQYVLGFEPEVTG